MKRRQSAFTMVELLVVVALVAIVLMVAAPAFNDYVVLQRLKGTSAALVTDMQLARSEAVSRGRRVFVIFRQGDANTMSCYTLYTDPADASGKCDCTKGDGERCPAGTTEIRTVQVPPAQAVRLALPDGQDADFSFDPLSGGIYVPPSDVERALPSPYVVQASSGSGRTLRTVISLGGRPMVCRPAGSEVSGGYPACS